MTKVSASGVLKKKVTSLSYSMKTFYKFSNNEYRPALVHFTTDYCASYAGLFNSPVQNMFKKLWENKTNAFQPCPIMPGEYYLKDWHFDASSLPSIFPVGRYLTKNVFLTESNELVMNNSFYFYVANYGILDLNMG